MFKSASWQRNRLFDWSLLWEWTQAKWSWKNCCSVPWQSSCNNARVINGTRKETNCQATLDSRSICEVATYSKERFSGHIHISTWPQANTMQSQDTAPSKQPTWCVFIYVQLRKNVCWRDQKESIHSHQRTPERRFPWKMGKNRGQRTCQELPGRVQVGWSTHSCCGGPVAGQEDPRGPLHSIKAERGSDHHQQGHWSAENEAMGPNFGETS